MKTKTIKVYEKFVVVEGTGDFPLDMLRYDCAFPATEHDSAIASHYSNRRAVALILRSVNDNGPTDPRWTSFLWKVIGVFPERREAESCRTARQFALEVERANREQPA